MKVQAAENQQSAISAQENKRLCPFVKFELPIQPTKEEVVTLIQQFVPLHKPTGNCSFRQFTDGLTNRLFKIAYDDEESKFQVLIRIYGEKTELLIDREKELRSMIALNKKGLAPRVYGQFVNGVCYGFFPGKPFSVEDMVDPVKSRLVARHLALFQSVEIPDIPTTPSLFITFDKWQKEVEKPDSSEKPSKDDIFSGVYTAKSFVKEVAWLKRQVDSFAHWRVAFCHNDLLCGNIIFHEGEVHFIDYEYGSYNYALFDVGNHLCEAMGVEVDINLFPSEEFIKQWLREYLSARKNVTVENVSDSRVDRALAQVKLMILAANLYWGVWALVQNRFSNVSFDYLLYSKKRLGAYYALKQRFGLAQQTL